MSQRNKKLVLIDGSSYLYRAFHAMPSLMNSKGQPTGAIYGVINMLRKLIADYQPTYIAVIFDTKGKTFRDTIYPEYKANRPPMPGDLRSQIQPLYDIIDAMGLPLLAIENVEADDVIATLAQQADDAGIACVISTGDKDIAQIVNHNITLVNTMSDTVLDIDGVKKKFGVPPELIVDYLTLIGDTVDNVPGVQKVGPKTAVKWLLEYGSLDGIIQQADTIKGKVGENLRAAIDHLPLSKALITLKKDVVLEKSPTDLKASAPKIDQLISLYKELEFKTWLTEYLDSNENVQVKQDKFYETITTEKIFECWLQRLKKSGFFTIDTETTSLDVMEAKLVGVSFAIKKNEAAYVPFNHHYNGAPKQLSADYVLSALKPILENAQIKKCGQNLKYDKSVFAQHDIQLNGIEFDTMLESYVLNSTASRHDMDTLALKYLGYKTIHFEEIAGKGAKQITFDQIPLEQAGPYAAEDADITLQLHEYLWAQLKEHERLSSVFQTIEMPLLSVLSKMERHGVLIDNKKLEKQSIDLASRIIDLKKAIFNLAGEEFNPDSPKQLREILFDKLDLPITQKTPTGVPSTAESVLQELSHTFELPALILEYRSLAKLKSTYTDRLPEQINQQTKRVHTSYHQAVAATGRLSSTAPNLQNIPIKTQQGRLIRQSFIAPEDHVILAADYSQIELRIMAHLSQDPNLIAAFQQGLDIHTATAAEVMGVELNKVTMDQRRRAKAVNFGLIYGMSAFGLAKQLDINRFEAQNYIDQYFFRYPKVQDYMNQTRELAHRQGYVETLFGRRLYLPEINAKNMMRQKAAERTAINAPMQGTAADIIKRAMIAVNDWLEKSFVKAAMIMQVHDELVFEIAKQDVDVAKNEIERCMVKAATLTVPLVVDVGVGVNWDEAH